MILPKIPPTLSLGSPQFGLTHPFIPPIFFKYEGAGGCISSLQSFAPCMTPVPQIKFADFVNKHNLHRKFNHEHMREMNATGGGAFKYAATIKSMLGLSTVPQHAYAPLALRDAILRLYVTGATPMDHSDGHRGWDVPQLNHRHKQAKRGVRGLTKRLLLHDHVVPMASRAVAESAFPLCCVKLCCGSFTRQRYDGLAALFWSQNGLFSPRFVWASIGPQCN